jgi:hypothetical protein
MDCKIKKTSAQVQKGNRGEKFMQFLCKGFERGEVNIARLNCAVIILIPKEEGVWCLKKFRPITLINYSFKIFAKALNNRLELVCDRLLALKQTVFVRGRYILESVVAAHEVVHAVKKNKDKCLVLKLDYENAWVSWQFLEKMLTSRGFGEKWAKWIMKVVKGKSISIRLNDEMSPYFKPGKGWDRVVGVVLLLGARSSG